MLYTELPWAAGQRQGRRGGGGLVSGDFESVVDRDWVLVDVAESAVASPDEIAAESDVAFGGAGDIGGYGADPGQVAVCAAGSFIQNQSRGVNVRREDFREAAADQDGVFESGTDAVQADVGDIGTWGAGGADPGAVARARVSVE